jgi:hypothetical protein
VSRVTPMASFEDVEAHQQEEAFSLTDVENRLRSHMLTLPEAERGKFASQWG